MACDPNLGWSPARYFCHNDPVHNIGLVTTMITEISAVNFRQNLALVDGLRFEVVPFDHEDTRRAGEIRAVLAASGTPIGGYDLLMAGQAGARDLILVSRNLREFTRVGRLNAENWEETPV